LIEEFLIFKGGPFSGNRFDMSNPLPFPFYCSGIKKMLGFKAI
jgi:hypothetical protein